MHKVEVFYVLCLFLTGKHKVMVSLQNHHDNISFLLVYQIEMDEKLWMKVNMFEQFWNVFPYKWFLTLSSLVYFIL